MLQSTLWMVSAVMTTCGDRGIPPAWRSQENLLCAAELPREQALLFSAENGYVGSQVGAGDLFVSGVYNGAGTTTPSHRARLDNPVGLGNWSTANISALCRDLATPSMIVRLCDTERDIRVYAHRTRRHVWVGVPHLSQWFHNHSALGAEDFITQERSAGLWVGITKVPEYPSFQTTRVVMRWSAVDGLLAVASSRDSADPRAVAEREFQSAMGAGRARLWQEHEEAWAGPLSMIRVDTQDVRLRRVVNASIGSLLGAVLGARDFPQAGLSVGGVATSSKYHGHVFSDAETWMGPVLQLLAPDTVRYGVLGYRLALRKGARDKAASYSAGYEGAMFPWESAASGNESCPESAPTGQFEQHISGDIALAVQRYWWATSDIEWLREEGDPLLQGIATFWASRVAPNGSICNVISMDERTGNMPRHVSNAVYTNALAKLSLQFANEVSAILGRAPNATWAEIASRIPLAENPSLDIHLPWDNYNGSWGGLPVLMLGFPGMIAMPESRRRADVLYYAGERTEETYAPKGMAQAQMAVALMEIGERDRAAVYQQQVYDDFAGPFLAVTELTADLEYGQLNFVTSCGGFLQTILFGWLGMRVNATALSFRNPFLPPGITSIELTRVAYKGGFLHVTMSTVLSVSVLQQSPVCQLHVDENTVHC